MYHIHLVRSSAYFLTSAAYFYSLLDFGNACLCLPTLILHLDKPKQYKINSQILFYMRKACEF